MPDPLAPRPALSRLARLRRDVRRTVLARRRPLAALCAGLAVVGVVRATRPPGEPTVGVVVAAHDLASGTRLTADDLSVRRYPRGLVPAGSGVPAVGRTLAGPVSRGEPITEVRLVAPSLLAGYPGQVAVPVRVADAGAVAMLRVGDHVDVVAADPRRGAATYVASDVPVLSLPPVDRGDEAAGATGRLVVLAVLPVT